MKQEYLYVTEQYVTYKGKKLRIRFLEEYFDSVPRPIDEEKRLLKEDIHRVGVNESIKINLEGVVLDGHTRIEICEELGWKTTEGKLLKPKYKVLQFKTKQEEREYVIKSNLMRRQLNSFQKVKLVAKLYNNNPHSQREQTRYDILLELQKSKKPLQAQIMGEKLGMHRGNISKILKGLKEDFCVNYKTTIQDPHKSIKPTHLYYILPKGEEILYHGRPESITLKKLGRSIGVSRDIVSRAIFLMERANSFMLAKLEKGDIGIMRAYIQVIREEKNSRVPRQYYLRGDSRVKCPHCKEISLKKEWEIIDGGKPEQS